MNKDFAVIESMTRIARHGYTFRIWRKEESVEGQHDNSDLRWVFALKKITPKNVREFAVKLAQMPRVNAVEVVDGNGNGILIYPEWP